MSEFSLTFTLQTRKVVDPPGVPLGTYVEQRCLFNGREMWHEYIGPVDNAVAIHLQDELKSNFNSTLYVLGSEIKRWAIPVARDAEEGYGL